MREVTFEPGEIVYDEGDDSDFVYRIREGTAEVTKHAPEGGVVVLSTLGLGDIFGEMGVIQRLPRAAGIRARSLLRVEQFERSSFISALGKDPDFALRVIEILCQRLAETNHRLAAETASREVVRLSAVQGIDIHPGSAFLSDQFQTFTVEPTNLPFIVGGSPASSSVWISRSNLVLEDIDPPLLSPEHFSLEFLNNCLVIRDRGSTGGTKVNDTPIGAFEPTSVEPLRAGINEISVGDAEGPFRFLVEVHAF